MQAQMVRRVRAYLETIRINEDETRLDELSKECEPPGEAGDLQLWPSNYFFKVTLSHPHELNVDLGLLKKIILLSYQIGPLSDDGSLNIFILTDVINW